MALLGLRISPNESQSTRLSIGDPPRPQIPTQKFKNRQTTTKSENRATGRLSQNFSRQQYESIFDDFHDFDDFGIVFGGLTLFPECPGTLREYPEGPGTL